MRMNKTAKTLKHPIKATQTYQICYKNNVISQKLNKKATKQNIEASKL